MTSSELQHLIDKYLSDELTEAEFRRLWETLDKPESEAAWLQAMDELQVSGLSDAAREDRALAAVQARMVEAPVRSINRGWWRYAAAIVLLLGTGSYFAYQYSVKNQPTIAGNTAQQPTEIEPGREGAILTLANGSQVVLDSLGNGTIATQNGTTVTLANGQLAYDAQHAGAVSMNTITIPRSRQFQLLLPDGTKIWLNSASTLRFPTAFTGSERSVEITGEAYFEVAADPQRPFLVNIGDTKIQVLGTSFNVNAYANEAAMHTTLLAGSVKVEHAGNSMLLKPGQQAKVTDNIKLINHADTDKVLAWKNGLFNFEGAGVQEVMNQLERWYDIEVVYEKGIPNLHFFGEMSRNVKLADVLAGLEGAGVHFKLDGRKLTVLP
ncbi:FecR domain-containing protein [Chitinophaga horti]|uniref:FecR domain-containing protein n=1 Tax=Chitinophaga horti TaxID=2920382 RepID=A0ABY6J770_9BACT|nr:FecR family protein [Chitinophaga horti]UYQ95488.1 FecR domain-containing protein [Chitinophaga horti]